MTTVTLVYPYFRPSNDNSIFRFPPLGLGYIAASLEKHGIPVDLVDCTFLSEQEAIMKVRGSNPRIVGIYAMFSMKKMALKMAKTLSQSCEVLVAGGPLPTSNPVDFLEDFDVVVIGEGEETMVELVGVIEKGADLSMVKGIVYKEKPNGKVRFTPSREFIQDLDSVPFPDRELFDNIPYKKYYSNRFGYTITSMITSWGCPFQCEFCSRPVFGNEFKTRSAANVVDEIEAILPLKYDRVWFADDCFTLDRKRLVGLCDEMVRRHVKIGWECLSRVDTIDSEVASKMKRAGCVRVFFGIESGNDRILALMRKQTTTSQA
jgi:anaerobic magnesium-protoporphyrin IX monomethyl ester cyclase